MEAAVFKNLVPAATERVYPGHFTINADGGGYGGDTTWPGLHSWQMVGAYPQLGRTRLVLDYLDFDRGLGSYRSAAAGRLRRRDAVLRGSCLTANIHFPSPLCAGSGKSPGLTLRFMACLGQKTLRYSKRQAIHFCRIELGVVL